MIGNIQTADFINPAGLQSIGNNLFLESAASGAPHIEVEPLLSSAQSPFDYANRAEVLIVTDIKRGDLPALAGAYARIIEAAGGGVLGLFTAIRRLRVVHGRIADRLGGGWQ